MIHDVILRAAAENELEAVRFLLMRESHSDPNLTRDLNSPAGVECKSLTPIYSQISNTTSRSQRIAILADPR